MIYCSSLGPCSSGQRVSVIISRSVYFVVWPGFCFQVRVKSTTSEREKLQFKARVGVPSV